MLLNMTSSVVPAPIPFGKDEKITDFKFSKQGEILATPMSPLRKWLYPFLISFHNRTSYECLPEKPSLAKAIGINPAVVLSSTLFFGFNKKIFDRGTHSQLCGISKGVFS